MWMWHPGKDLLVTDEENKFGMLEKWRTKISQWEFLFPFFFPKKRQFSAGSLTTQINTCPVLNAIMKNHVKFFINIVLYPKSSLEEAYVTFEHLLGMYACSGCCIRYFAQHITSEGLLIIVRYKYFYFIDMLINSLDSCSDFFCTSMERET